MARADRRQGCQNGRIQSGRVGRIGAPAYVLATAVEICSHEPTRLRCSGDSGWSGEARALNLSVCNGKYFGGGMSPCPQASVSDGVLDVALVHAMPVGRALVRLRALMRGTLEDDPAITRFRCSSLRVEGPDLPLEMDGELRGGLPAVLSVRARGLRVRMPK